MPLWTVHPRHLDRQEVTTSWREALLAQKVLEGGTICYLNHPSSSDFGTTRTRPPASLPSSRPPLTRRPDRLPHDIVKITARPTTSTIETTDGQLMYEWHHLRENLASRGPETARRWAHVECPEAHPLFTIVTGSVASWERV